MSFYARATGTGDGTTKDFSVPFPYLRQEHVQVFLRDSVSDTTPTLLTLGVDYTFTSTSIIHLNTAPAAGALVDRIRSTSPSAPIVPWGNGTLTENELATNHLQLLYLVQEADDLALVDSTGLVIEPSELVTPVSIPKYAPVVPLDNSAYPAGLQIDNLGRITDTGARELWLDMFYTDDSTTDTQALLNFAALYNANTWPDGVTLKLRPGKGRGTSNRYFVDSEILFTVGTHLTLDFNGATVRMTNAASRFHYDCPQISPSSSVVPINEFIVKNGNMQVAAAIDSVFYWDLEYHPARNFTTGYAENMRIYPQNSNDATQTCRSHYRTKNTWYFNLVNCHSQGVARLAGALQANQAAVRQEQLCVILNIDRCEFTNFDSSLEAGVAALVGCEGTFSGGAAFGRGEIVRQGANSAKFGRNDSFGGSTYSLYDEVGTLVPGACDVLDSTGTVTGTFTISSINRYSQVSEAISVRGGTTFVGVNYLINATSPNASTRFLEWSFIDCHCFYEISALKIDGLASLMVGDGVYWAPSKSGTTMMDLNNIDMLSVKNGTYSTNDKPNCTWIKARNVSAGSVSGNLLYFFKYAGDFDNTVKSFVCANNRAYELTTGNNPTVATFLNTGKRYNASNTRGILFKSNGLMGAGFDVDDGRSMPWTPTLTADSGSATYTTQFGKINVNNGVLSYSVKINVTALSSPAGTMYISFPSLASYFGVADSFLPDQHLCSARVASWMAAGIFRVIGSTLQIQVTDIDPTTLPASGWNGLGSALSAPFAIYVSGQVPIEYD